MSVLSSRVWSLGPKANGAGRRVSGLAVRTRIGAYADKKATLDERNAIYQDLIGFVPPRIEARMAVTGALDPQLLDMQETMREHAMYPKCFDTKTAQLMLFETLDPATQRALLVRAAANADRADRDVIAMAAAWSRGDVEALAKIVNEDVDRVPAARKALLTDRNRRWSAWVERRLEQPGTVLMAVGAGHLVGDDGVPAVLAAEGYKVTRVQ